LIGFGLVGRVSGNTLPPCAFSLCRAGRLVERTRMEPPR
jgi:hypothetical protein